jgi:hypothetical protein
MRDLTDSECDIHFSVNPIVLIFEITYSFNCFNAHRMLYSITDVFLENFRNDRTGFLNSMLVISI